MHDIIDHHFADTLLPLDNGEFMLDALGCYDSDNK